MHGSWWELFPVQERCLSVGIHVETRKRFTGMSRTAYGPYVDLHLGFFVLSLGRNPIYAGQEDLDSPYSRGGLSGDCH